MKKLDRKIVRFSLLGLMGIVILGLIFKTQLTACIIGTVMLYFYGMYIVSNAFLMLPFLHVTQFISDRVEEILPKLEDRTDIIHYIIVGLITITLHIGIPVGASMMKGYGANFGKAKMFNCKCSEIINVENK